MSSVLSTIAISWGIVPDACLQPALPEQAPQQEVLEQQVARLEALARQYKIVPHFNTQGGDGFTHPLGGEWLEAHWDAVCEFSQLWYSPAGTAFIDKWGQHMRVRPGLGVPPAAAGPSPT